MQLNGWGLLAVCNHSNKFSDHRHCGNGDLMFLICHVTSHDHVFKGLYGFTDGTQSR